MSASPTPNSPRQTSANRASARPVGTPTPVIVLTGFLGSGKSTLLRALLAEEAFAGSGVIVNEFGDVAIDHDLVEVGRSQVAVTSTGCLCCTMGSDIRASLSELHEAARAAGRLPLPRVIVETTGLADPAPAINQLVPGAVHAHGLRDHVVARHYRLAGVVTTFDAVLGGGTLDRHAECVKQIALADRILLTKTDLLPDETRDKDLTAARTRLAAINDVAALTDVRDPAFSLPEAFALRPVTAQDAAGGVEDWLAMIGHDRGAGSSADAHCDHHQHEQHHHGEHDDDEHDHGHHHGHDDGVRSIAIVRDGPVSREAFAHFMDLVGAMLGPQLLRLKGVIGFEDDPDRPTVLHAVQHIVHTSVRLDAWPGADRRTRLVAITHGIDPTVIGRLFDAAFEAPQNQADEETARTNSAGEDARTRPAGEDVIDAPADQNTGGRMAPA